jgi:hypothetical protein
VLLKHFVLKSIEVSKLTVARVLLVHTNDEAVAAFCCR